MAEFVQIVSGRRTQAVAVGHVTHVEWETATDGRDAIIRLHLLNGVLLSCPVSDPAAEGVAKAFGLGALYAAWPKQKAEADARFKADKEQRAAGDRRRGLQRVA